MAVDEWTSRARWTSSLGPAALAQFLRKRSNGSVQPQKHGLCDNVPVLHASLPRHETQNWRSIHCGRTYGSPDGQLSGLQRHLDSSEPRPPRKGKHAPNDSNSDSDNRPSNGLPNPSSSSLARMINPSE